LDRITEKGEIHFLSLVHGMREKIRLVITFVALLELTKMEKIGIKESTVFNDFVIYGIANG
jgi:segregation and condensation protein A